MNNTAPTNPVVLMHAEQYGWHWRQVLRDGQLSGSCIPLGWETIPINATDDDRRKALELLMAEARKTFLTIKKKYKPPMKEATYTVFDKDGRVMGQVRASNKKEAMQEARFKYQDETRKPHSVERVTRWRIQRSKG